MLGQRIIAFRKWAKLSQEQLAARLDVTQRTVSRMELDEVDDPRVSVAARLERESAHWPDGPIRMTEWAAAA